MLQPFEILSSLYIARLFKLNKIYLVAQSYNRGLDHFADDPKIGILVTDYDDRGLAKIHLAAVKSDKYASIIELTNPRHVEKINEMLDSRSKYIVYWAIVKDLEALKKKISLRYKDNVMRYLTKNTTWRIGGDETIRPQLQIIFGELFVILKRGSQDLRIKFEDIETS